MKYLGIIIDKFKFSDHISYAAERSSKLIHSLSKAAKFHGDLTTKHLRPFTRELFYLYYCMGPRFGQRP